MDNLLKVTNNAVEPWRPIGSDWAEGLPEGWQDILDQLRLTLGIFKIWHPEMKFEISQLKEKFGELTIYYTLEPLKSEKDFQRIKMAIDLAEILSYWTCVECGEQAVYRTRGGWVAPFCAVCAEECRPGEDYEVLPE